MLGVKTAASGRVAAHVSKIQPMRAFLVMLMFTLLALPFSAAVASGYCEHVATTQYVQGAYSHSAHGESLADAEDLATGANGLDLDCGTCHTNCVDAVMTAVPSLADPAGIERLEPLIESLVPPWQTRPYRPQWLAPRGSGRNALT